MALGSPSISQPKQDDNRSLQTAVSNIRQRIEALEALLTSTSATATATANSTTTNLNSILNTLSLLQSEITALQNAQTTDVESFIAGEAILAGQCVVPINTTTVGVADPSDTTRMFGLLGVAIGPAAPGSQVLVQRRGVFTVAGASGFLTGRAVYCDAVGGITQTPDYDATALPLGVAVSSTTIFVAPDWPALLYPTFSSGIEDSFEGYLPLTYRAALSLVGSNLQDQINALPYQSGASPDMDVPVTIAGIAVRVTAGDIAALGGGGGGLTPIAAGDLLANLTGGSAVPVGHPFSDVVSALSFQSGADVNMEVPALIDAGTTAVRITIADIVALASGGGLTPIPAGDLLANLTGGSAIPIGHPFSDVLSALSTQSGAERLSLVPVLLGSTAVLCSAEDIASLANLASLIAALPYSSGVTPGALVPVEIGGVAVTVTAEDIAALAQAPSTLVTFNPQTASYTLVTGDMDNLHWVEMNVGSANNLTVPTNATVAASVGATVLWSQLGAGQTTIVAAVGVTLLYSSTLKARAQNSTGGMTKKATDTWYVYGDLV
jgi:Uncharacterized conserved protein (DUF2190)